MTDAGRSVAAAGQSVAAAGRGVAAAGRSVTDAAAGRSWLLLLAPLMRLRVPQDKMGSEHHAFGNLCCPLPILSADCGSHHM
jgi:hypothetical protein